MANDQLVRMSSREQHAAATSAQKLKIETMARPPWSRRNAEKYFESRTTCNLIVAEVARDFLADSATEMPHSVTERGSHPTRLLVNSQPRTIIRRLWEGSEGRRAHLGYEAAYGIDQNLSNCPHNNCITGAAFVHFPLTLPDCLGESTKLVTLTELPPTYMLIFGSMTCWPAATERT